MSASPNTSTTSASCILCARPVPANSSNARENVASLGISPTRDQPHSRRNAGSALSLSIRCRRQCVDHLQAELGISERRACAVAGQHRSTQRKRPRGRDDEEALTAAIIRLASQYGRYGYRRITALLRTEGWHMNAKRVQRIWWREGLKVPLSHSLPRFGCFSVCGRAGPITSGLMTSSWIEHTMGGSSACSP